MTALKDTTPKQAQQSYTLKDAMSIADDIFKLNKEKEFHPAAFIHGLIIALEASQQMYKVPPREIAAVKRVVRKYFQEIDENKSLD